MGVLIWIGGDFVISLNNMAFGDGKHDAWSKNGMVIRNARSLSILDRYGKKIGKIDKYGDIYSLHNGKHVNLAPRVLNPYSDHKLFEYVNRLAVRSNWEPCKLYGRKCERQTYFYK